MADVDSLFTSWSTNAASNKPTDSTVIGSGLDDNLRQIQATVRQFLGSVSSDIASAATVDLSSVPGNHTNITGSVTITSLGTVDAGIWKTLNFTGAPLIKYSATSLITPNGADITAAVGDGAYIVSLGGGNWRMPFYQKASGRAFTFPLLSDPATNTAVALGDYIPYYDVSGVVNAKATLQDLYNQLGSLTAATTSALNISADSLVLYSATSAATYKVAPINLVPKATQALMETSSLSGTAVVTPAVMQYFPGVAKAWVNFQGGGTVVGAYNVSGVSNAGSGNYVITFTTPFSSASYSGVITVIDQAATVARGTSLSTNRYTVQCFTTNTTTGATPDNVHGAFFGDQ